MPPPLCRAHARAPSAHAKTACGAKTAPSAHKRTRSFADARARPFADTHAAAPGRVLHRHSLHHARDRQWSVCVRLWGAGARRAMCALGVPARPARCKRVARCPTCWLAIVPADDAEVLDGAVELLSGVFDDAVAMGPLDQLLNVQASMGAFASKLSRNFCPSSPISPMAIIHVCVCVCCCSCKSATFNRVQPRPRVRKRTSSLSQKKTSKNCLENWPVLAASLVGLQFEC